MTPFTIGLTIGFTLGLAIAIWVWRRSRRRIEELQQLLKTPIGKLVNGRIPK